MNFTVGGVSVGDDLLAKTASNPPLAAGTYEIIFTGVGATDITAHTFDLQVSAIGAAATVPKPESLALPGLGICAIDLARRSRRRLQMRARRRGKPASAGFFHLAVRWALRDYAVRRMDCLFVLLLDPAALARRRRVT